MYPPVRQLETRLREAEEWIAVREARRLARSNARTAHSRPRWVARLAGLGRSLLPSTPRHEPGGPRDPQRVQHRRSLGLTDTIAIRRSTSEDREAILRLAALDGREPPASDSLLAFVGAELRVALPLGTGEPIADPFHGTAELVELLRLPTTGWGRVVLRRGRTLRLRLAFGGR
jgi:hypothetical protein